MCSLLTILLHSSAQGPALVNNCNTSTTVLNIKCCHQTTLLYDSSISWNRPTTKNHGQLHSEWQCKTWKIQFVINRSFRCPTRGGSICQEQSCWISTFALTLALAALPSQTDEGLSDPHRHIPGQRVVKNKLHLRSPAYVIIQQLCQICNIYGCHYITKWYNY